MWNLVLFLVLSAAALLALDMLRRRSGAPAPSGRSPARRPPRAPTPGTRPRPTPGRALPALVEVPLSPEALRSRLRDRYVAARFPGLLQCARDLENIDEVIRFARLYFENEKFDEANELLDMAIEHSPQNRALRLAQIEIAYLRRDPALFAALAAAFRDRNPQCVEWPQIARLGRHIAPDAEPFASDGVVATGSSYGPWPEMPNWIQASWDLTPEVLAADFHHAMLHPARRHATPRPDHRHTIGS
jgi:hypothetical protein